MTHPPALTRNCPPFPEAELADIARWGTGSIPVTQRLARELIETRRRNDDLETATRNRGVELARLTAALEERTAQLAEAHRRLGAMRVELEQERAEVERLNHQVALAQQRIEQAMTERLTPGAGDGFFGRRGE